MTKNPPTPPSTARSSARSASKRAGATRKPGKPWPAKVKAEALTLLGEEGMAAAHDVTGVPKATLSMWARAAGIDLGEAARARTSTATEAVRERAERAKLNTVALLESHLGDAGSYLSAIVQANAAAAEAILGLSASALTLVTVDGEEVVDVDDEEAAALTRVARALANLPLHPRDAEGIVTRAIHDLQLLQGEATERGELVVEFGGIPRPDPRKVEVVEFESEED